MHTDLKNPYYRKWLSFLKSTETWSRDEIKAYQLSKIKELIKYAFYNTEGYRSLYRKSGVDPENINSFADFSSILLVDKETIRDNQESFSVNIKRRQYITTGGSTGIPFGFYRDPESFGRELASKAYQYYRIGWKENARQMVLRGLPVNNKKHMRYYPRFNELRCSSYFLTPEYMEKYRQRALNYKPRFLRCYPSSGYIFASFLKENNLKFPKLKGVLCASENLYDFQKQTMSEVFGCRIFSHYGHYECSVLAGYCEYTDDYHVLPQYGYAELRDKNGKLVNRPGEVGEIIATSFIMKATPFIRYRTMDLATFRAERCSRCGRPYQIWEKIDGRLQEFVITKGGRYISMTAINMHDHTFDLLKQFQFFQQRPGEVSLRYIPKADLSRSSENKMLQRLSAKFGDDLLIKPEKVKEIPLTKRGKHRFLIQKLNIRYQDII